MTKINLWFINMPSQKIKQKTNIKININLAEKRKRKKQKRKTKSQGTSNSQTTAQNLLARQPIVINNTRPLPENNSGNILDVIRNQQSQINKHGELIKSGMSSLEFVNNVIKGNYKPLKTEYTTPAKEYTTETTKRRRIKIKKETVKPEVKKESVETDANEFKEYIKQQKEEIAEFFSKQADLDDKATKDTPIRNLFLSISGGQIPIGKNIKNRTLLNTILRDEELMNTALLYVEGKRAIDKANIEALEEAMKSGRITTKRGGSRGGGLLDLPATEDALNPLFNEQDEPAGLLDT